MRFLRIVAPVCFAALLQGSSAGHASVATDPARMRGVHFNRERARSFDALDEPWVIHCAGMGAADLARDGTMVPVLGHLIRLGAQRKWALTQYMCGAPVGNGQFYYLPKRDADCRGVIGGTAIEGEGDPMARPEAFDQVWAQARQFLYGETFRA